MLLRLYPLDGHYSKNCKGCTVAELQNYGLWAYTLGESLVSTKKNITMCNILLLMIQDIYLAMDYLYKVATCVQLLYVTKFWQNKILGKSLVDSIFSQLTLYKNILMNQS